MSDDRVLWQREIDGALAHIHPSNKRWNAAVGTVAVYRDQLWELLTQERTPDINGLFWHHKNAYGLRLGLDLFAALDGMSRRVRPSLVVHNALKGMVVRPPSYLNERDYLFCAVGAKLIGGATGGYVRGWWTARPMFVHTDITGGEREIDLVADFASNPVVQAMSVAMLNPEIVRSMYPHAEQGLLAEINSLAARIPQLRVEVL